MLFNLLAIYLGFNTAIICLNSEGSEYATPKCAVLALGLFEMMETESQQMQEECSPFLLPI